MRTARSIHQVRGYAYAIACIDPDGLRSSADYGMTSTLSATRHPIRRAMDQTCIALVLSHGKNVAVSAPTISA